MTYKTHHLPALGRSLGSSTTPSTPSLHFRGSFQATLLFVAEGMQELMGLVLAKDQTREMYIELRQDSERSRNKID
jgi:hypothetical protein